MPRILNFGSLNLDYVYKVSHFVQAGETLSSDALQINCGGKGLNQSIAAAKAGAEVYHAGKIGPDGAMLATMLTENGVDICHLAQDGDKTGHAIIQVDTTGQNCILLFPGANREIKEEEIDRCLACFEKGDLLLLQNEINGIPRLMEKAAAIGMKIVFNPSPITAELTGYPLNKVSLFVLNEIEGAALSGETDPAKILTALRNKYPSSAVLLTLGSEGAIYDDGTIHTEHGIYKATVADTTAAGDTLTGYFASALAAGQAPASALEIASKAAAITVSRPGAAHSIPTLEEAKACPFPYSK